MQWQFFDWLAICYLFLKHDWSLVFNQRSEEKELLDDLSVRGPELDSNLREIKFINRWFGGKTTLLSAFNEILVQYPEKFARRSISIMDLGCGAGDLLDALDKWATKNRLNVQLLGLDANPAMIDYAIEYSKLNRRIQFEFANLLSESFKTRSYDIVCLNTICHHLNNAELINLLLQLRKQTCVAIVINDLHRHWLAYFSIKLMSKILHFSIMAQNDGPLSVLRAFKKYELINIFKTTGFSKYTIRWHWAFRWEVILWI